MANETTTTNAGSGNPTLIDARLILEIRESAVGMNFLEMVDLSNSPGLSYTFPDLTATPSATAITTGATEADAVANTALTTAARTATAASKAVYVTISHLNKSASVIPWDSELPGILGRALADLMDVDCLALINGFATTKGTTNVPLTMAVMRDSLTSFRANAKSAASEGVIVMHPTQAGQLEAELQSGAGGSLGTVFVNSDVATWFRTTPGQGVLGSYRGAFSGVPVFCSTNVPTSTPDNYFAVFANQLALGGVIKWRPETRLFDAGVNRQLADVWQGRIAYGVVEKKDLYGVTGIAKT